MGIEVITLALGAIGTLAATAGSIAQGSAQAKQMQYQAKVAQNNQKIAEQNATYAEAQNAKREQEEVWKTRALMGSQIAQQAASGLEVNFGSPFLVTQSTREIGNLSIDNVREEGRKTAHAYRSQGAQFGAEAAGLAAGASGAKSASYLDAFSTFIGGASAVGSNWHRMASTGVAYDDIDLVFG